MVSIKISPRPQKDMLEIKYYISEELSNPTAAKSVLSIISKRIQDSNWFSSSLTASSKVPC